MENTDFIKIADQTLVQIVDIIETNDMDGDIDIDFHGDILNLTTQKGKFVINRHSLAKEIWLASPISGPYHFYYHEGKWQSKAGTELMEILTRELKINF